jgi:hypothetical protein
LSPAVGPDRRSTIACRATSRSASTVLDVFAVRRDDRSRRAQTMGCCWSPLACSPSQWWRSLLLVSRRVLAACLPGSRPRFRGSARDALTLPRALPRGSTDCAWLRACNGGSGGVDISALPGREAATAMRARRGVPRNHPAGPPPMGRRREIADSRSARACEPEFGGADIPICACRRRPAGPSGSRGFLPSSPRRAPRLRRSGAPLTAGGRMDLIGLLEHTKQLETAGQL